MVFKPNFQQSPPPLTPSPPPPTISSSPSPSPTRIAPTPLRVYYFVLDDYSDREEDEIQFFEHYDGFIIERNQFGEVVTAFNTNFVREIGYKPKPIPPTQPEPRYEPHSNTLYKP